MTGVLHIYSEITGRACDLMSSYTSLMFTQHETIKKFKKIFCIHIFNSINLIPALDHYTKDISLINTSIKILTLFKLFLDTLSNIFDILVKYSLEWSGFLNYGLRVLWLDWLTHTSCHQIISQSVKTKHIINRSNRKHKKGKNILKVKKIKRNFHY